MGGRPLLEAVGSDLEGQGYGEHRRDVTVDVLARTPDIGEPLAAPKTRPGSCFTDRGHGSLDLVTHREVSGKPSKKSSGFRSTSSTATPEP